MRSHCLAAGVYMRRFANFAKDMSFLYRSCLLAAINRLLRRCLWPTWGVACILLAISTNGKDRPAFRNATPISILSEELEAPPAIVVEPNDRSANLGDSASFNVGVAGNVPMTFQWFKDGNPILGATSVVLVIEAVQINDAGVYWVAVTNSYGWVCSREAQLTLNHPPTITSQPNDLTVNLGGEVSIACPAEGTRPLVFQWFKDGATILSTKTSRLDFTNAQALDAGSYWVVVTNIAGCATSQVARLKVILPPTITEQPASQIITVLGRVTFEAQASGTEPLICQWLKNGRFVNGATNMVFTLESAQISDAGEYSLVVSNMAGCATSQVANLTLILPPLITQQPAHQTLQIGEWAHLSLMANGTEPLRYQWFKESSALPGETNADYLFLVSDDSLFGNYFATVENAAGKATSSVANLTLGTRASLRGLVTDALSKQPLAGVTIRIGNSEQTTAANGSYAFTNLTARSWQADFAASATTGSAPLAVNFSYQLMDAAYTLQAQKDGFWQYSYAALELNSGEEREWNFSLAPATDGLRLVLNWGQAPRDLDAHLLTPSIEGTSYHIQCFSKYYGCKYQPPYAQLDTDATAGFGPETISIFSSAPGWYRFFVRNFKEEQGPTGELAGSGTVAQIYNATGLAHTMTVPATGSGDYWDVCAIDGVSGQVYPINHIQSFAPETTNAIPASTSGISQFAWDFGDGGASNLENPSHTYLTGGAYSVSLRINLPDGRIKMLTKTNLVQVEGGVAELPKLAIICDQSQLILRWPASAEGFVLERNDTLAVTNWNALTVAPTTNTDGLIENRVTNDGRGFFRLRK